jgi:molybdopterin/thiamine biosynthesis adenylyltransferase
MALGRVKMDVLTKNELERYSRQILIKDFGEEFQYKLKSSHVVIMGVGGLGCSSSNYLAAAGVGHITIVDKDTIKLSNLNRQILYSEDDIGEKKVDIAFKRLSRLNPYIEITPIFADITEYNVSTLIVDNTTVVIDGLDNMNTRFLVNHACVSKKIPFIYAGVSRFRGMITTIIPGKTPCLACIYPKGMGGSGVFGAAPGIIANFQVLEAVRLITGQLPILGGKLLLFRGDDMDIRTYDIVKNVSCSVCSSIM